MKISTTHAPEHRTTPRRIQSGNSVQEWRTFMMKMHHARTGAPYYSAADPADTHCPYQHRQNP
jgi:hypothetical protein